MKSEKLIFEIDSMGNKIKQEILKLGVSQSSEKTDLKRSDIYAWMNNKRNWTFNKILSVAQKLDL